MVQKIRRKLRLFSINLAKIIKVPIDARRYLGMLVSVELDAGIKTAREEKIQREEDIFLTPLISITRKDRVKNRSR